jgi:hypothetical protein
VSSEAISSPIADRTPPSARNAKKNVWLDSISASRCRGFGYDLSGGTFFVSPRPCAWSERTAIIETLAIEACLYSSIPLTVDLPPPRAVFLPFA